MRRKLLIVCTTILLLVALLALPINAMTLLIEAEELPDASEASEDYVYHVGDKYYSVDGSLKWTLSHDTVYVSQWRGELLLSNGDKIGFVENRNPDGMNVIFQINYSAAADSGRQGWSRDVKSGTAFPIESSSFSEFDWKLSKSGNDYIFEITHIKTEAFRDVTFTYDEANAYHFICTPNQSWTEVAEPVPGRYALGPGSSVSDWLIGPSAGSGLPFYGMPMSYFMEKRFSASYYLSYFTPITYTSMADYNFDLSVELLFSMDISGGELSRFDHKLTVEPPSSVKGSCTVTPETTFYYRNGDQIVQTGESFQLPLNLLLGCSLRGMYNTTTEELTVSYDFLGKSVNTTGNTFYQYNYYFDMQDYAIPHQGGQVFAIGTFKSRSNMCAALLDTKILSGFRAGVVPSDYEAQVEKSAELFALYENLTAVLGNAPVGDLQQKYQQGFAAGLQQGLADGYRDGYNQAVVDNDNATSEMVTEAEKKAYAKGKNDGIDIGYKQGLDAANSVKESIDLIGKHIVSSLNVFAANGTIFGVTLANIISTLVACLSIFWFVKKVT